MVAIPGLPDHSEKAKSLPSSPKCYFLEIPPELRLNIYGHLLDCNGYAEKVLDLTCAPEIKVLRVREKDRIMLESNDCMGKVIVQCYKSEDLLPWLAYILRVCKTIHAEALSLVTASLESKTCEISVRLSSKSCPATSMCKSWLLDKCPLLQHVRHLQLRIYLRDVDGRQSDILHKPGPLENLIAAIDYGTGLKTLHITGVSARWPRKELAKALKVLDQIECAFTMEPDRAILTKYLEAGDD